MPGLNDGLIPATELESCRSAGDLLLDVRTPGEFAAGHIPGSVNIPLPDLNAALPELMDRLSKGQRAVLICRTGQRAAKAQEILAGAGTRAVVLEGGVERASCPLASAGAAGMSLERQVRIAAGGLVVLGVALGQLVHPAFYALSAFVGAGLVFAGITDTCGMGMVLARMPWNRRR